MRIGGQYDVQSGRSGMEKEEDQEDGATSNSGKGQFGPGQQRTQATMEKPSGGVLLLRIQGVLLLLV